MIFLLDGKLNRPRCRWAAAGLGAQATHPAAGPEPLPGVLGVSKLLGEQRGVTSAAHTFGCRPKRRNQNLAASAFTATGHRAPLPLSELLPTGHGGGKGLSSGLLPLGPALSTPQKDAQGSAVFPAGEAWSLAARGMGNSITGPLVSLCRPRLF